ncbi:MAG: hypothetical protein JNL57_02505 [Bacteroidetes bacterium]|nr:hypothetical protein [Bacteroidota bacterium]
MKPSLRHILTHCMKPEMIQYAQENPHYKQEMLDLAVSDETPCAWRAAWLLCDVMSVNDPEAKKYVPQIFFRMKNAPDGHIRELLKVLKKLDLTTEQEWQLYGICRDLWQDIQKQGSLRWHALQQIIHMTKTYPELKDEFDYLTEPRFLDSLSHGARKSALGLLQKM